MCPGSERLPGVRGRDPPQREDGAGGASNQRSESVCAERRCFSGRLREGREQRLVGARSGFEACPIMSRHADGSGEDRSGIREVHAPLGQMHTGRVESAGEVDPRRHEKKSARLHARRAHRATFGENFATGRPAPEEHRHVTREPRVHPVEGTHLGRDPEEARDAHSSSSRARCASLELG